MGASWAPRAKISSKTRFVGAPGASQEGPKMESDRILGTKIAKKGSRRTKWLPDGSQDPFRQEVPPTFTNFGVPSGTPKLTKNRSQFDQKSSQNWSSTFNASRSPIWLPKPAILGAKSTKNRSKTVSKLRCKFECIFGGHFGCHFGPKN